MRAFTPEAARRSARSCAGFTLMELMTVVVIILVLAMLILQTSESWRARADEARCISNLKSLYVGATVYMQDQQHWPQVNARLITSDYHAYGLAWFKAFAPYGISRKTWVCPTTQHGLGDPDLDQDKNMRVDYIATPFDERPSTPYAWSTQPWFIEKGSAHSGGNLMVFEDAQIMSLTAAMHRKASQ